MYDALWSTGIAKVSISQLPQSLQQMLSSSPGLDSAHTAQDLINRGVLQLEIGGPPDHQTVMMKVSAGKEPPGNR
jgi:hypothetical protein